MRHLAVALIVIALCAFDFAAHAVPLSGPEQTGWSWASSLGILFAGWYFVRCVKDGDW